MLNHASYGVTTHALLARAETVRRELDSDPNVLLGDALLERLDGVTARLCADLGLDPACTALTTSATAGAAALQRCLPLAPGDVVIALDCEYSSVLRGWRRRCDEVGAHLRVVPVPLPLHDVDTLLARMTEVAAGERIAVLQFSAVTSSAALRLPVARLAAWGHDHGALVVVDAAHGPGQIDVGGWDGVDAAFGTLHKWIPVPRSVGLLWSTTELADLVRPAEVSLTFDDARMGRRFSWPGTFDPAARLCLPDALDVQSAWESAGLLARCEDLADRATEILTAAGAVPTAATALSPPRMRAFLLPGVPEPVLRQRLLDAGVRAWTGARDARNSFLRVALHIYNDEDDIGLVAREVRTLYDR